MSKMIRKIVWNEIDGMPEEVWVPAGPTVEDVAYREFRREEGWDEEESEW